MDDAGEFAAARMKLLTEHIGDLYGRPSFGWQAKTARRMGLSSSYVSRLLSGERVAVGLDAIERAVRNVPIRREFFAPGAVPGEKPNDADWRDYIAEPSPEVGPHSKLAEQAGRFVLYQCNDASARALAEAVLSDPAIAAALTVKNAPPGEATNAGVALAAVLLASGRSNQTPLPEPVSANLPRIRVRALTSPSPATAPRLPWPGAKGRYVGWRRATSADPRESRVRFTPDGPEFVHLAEVDVPDSPYFQKAIRKGDLILLT